VDLNTKITNVSWGKVRAQIVLDRHGFDTAAVVAKIAYRAGPDGRLTLADRPPRAIEVADGFGGIRFPYDFVDIKPGTDVVLVGTAHPSSSRASERHLAWVFCGPLRKVIEVFKRRVYMPGTPTPRPGREIGSAEPVPLRYDQAYGGKEVNARPLAEEAHNPIGRGFASDPEKLVGQDAPRLEPVADPKTGRVAQPYHACFAPIPPHFEPRRTLAGTHDEAWVKSRMPIRPRDFSPQHHGFAPPELHTAEPLKGALEVEVGGVRPEGVWRFTLPDYGFSFAYKLREHLEDQRLETHLDTILIDADDQVVELSFRASFRAPKRLELIEKIEVLGRGILPREVTHGTSALPTSHAATTTP
jgi:hypothetical protein